MKTIDFFSTGPSMRCYQGSALPEFRLTVTDVPNLSECSMRMVLEDCKVPGSVAKTKACEYFTDDTAEGFTVQLDSTDTARLCGTYTVFFILRDVSGNDSKNLVATLEVLPSPKEE